MHRKRNIEGEREKGKNGKREKGKREKRKKGRREEGRKGKREGGEREKGRLYAGGGSSLVGSYLIRPSLHLPMMQGSVLLLLAHRF